MYVLPEYYASYPIPGSLWAPYWLQRIANPVLEDIYPDSHIWVINVSWRKQFICRGWENLWQSYNRMAENDVYLLHNIRWSCATRELIQKSIAEPPTLSVWGCRLCEPVMPSPEQNPNRHGWAALKCQRVTRRNGSVSSSPTKLCEIPSFVAL